VADARPVQSIRHRQAAAAAAATTTGKAYGSAAVQLSQITWRQSDDRTQFGRPLPSIYYWVVQLQHQTPVIKLCRTLALFAGSTHASSLLCIKPEKWYQLLSRTKIAALE